MTQNRLKTLFQNKSKNLLSIYVSAGYPELTSMPKLVKILENSGVDFIEAGMPYSDPLADGPTIQLSSSVALRNGMTLETYFEQIKLIRKSSDLPIIFMGYFNQILKTGIVEFLNKCVDVGIDALIVPDLTPEIYQKKYQKTFKQSNIPLIFLVSPTTSDERIYLIDKLSDAFIYVVSSSATTGKKGSFGEQEKAYFNRIKKLNLNNPTIIGFGIDNSTKYQMACQYANGAIIGSAFIKTLETDDYFQASQDFIGKIKNQDF